MSHLHIYIATCDPSNQPGDCIAFYNATKKLTTDDECKRYLFYFPPKLYLVNNLTASAKHIEHSRLLDTNTDTHKLTYMHTDTNCLSEDCQLVTEVGHWHLRSSDVYRCAHYV